MKHPLREHQKRCHDFLWRKRYGIDQSEMGCGKSVTALSLVERSGLQATIVVPAYLAGNWINEIHKHTNLTCEQFRPAKNKQKVNMNPDILVVSYSMLSKAEAAIKGRKFLIADEAHYLANPSSKRSKLFRSYVQRFKPERMVLLSGTLLRNSVSELWHPLCLCDYGHDRGFRREFRSKYRFCDMFMYRTQRRIYGRYIVDWEGRRNEKALKKWLGAYSIRVKINELTELPPLLRIPMVCAAMDKKLDKELWEAYEQWKENIIGGANIHTVKAKNAAAKAPFTVAFCEEMLDEKRGPLLVFTDHVLAAHRLCESLATAYKVGLVTGQTAMKKRTQLVEEFQAKRLDVLVATIGSMSHGFTLTEANIVIFNDKDFDPSKNRQAAGRILRIGQRADKVLCYEVLREGVDQRIDELIEEKQDVTNTIMEEFEGADLEW